MGARRFFVQDEHRIGDELTISDTDAHKIARVLRLRAGDRIEIVDSTSQLFDARLESVGDTVVACLTSVRISTHADPFAITVAQGVPKGQKMDFVVEKLCELGAAALVPLISERTVIRDVGEAKLERWRRISETAAKQSGRTTLMALQQQTDFAALIETFGGYDTVLMPWEVSEMGALRDTLPALVQDARTVLVVVGPEGGFSHDEAEAARARGAHLISLGSRILRTETAALALLAILQYIGH